MKNMKILLILVLTLGCAGLGLAEEESWEPLQGRP